jgi:hypothetical protein
MSCRVFHLNGSGRVPFHPSFSVRALAYVSSHISQTSNTFFRQAISDGQETVVELIRLVYVTK